MIDVQEKYDELDNLISTLQILIDEIDDEEYKSDLREIKWKAEDEIGIYEEILQKQYDEEQAELEREYIRSVI